MRQRIISIYYRPQGGLQGLDNIQERDNSTNQSSSIQFTVRVSTLQWLFFWLWV